MDRDSRPTEQHLGEPRSTAKPEKWPSAREILATHRNRPRPEATPAQAGRKSPKDAPTPAREPAQWSLPAWVAGPPAAVLFMAIGLATCALSWLWADESYSASIMTARLLAADRTGQRGRLPESCAPPTGSWIRSTAQHLAHWAMFMSLPEPGKEPSPREVRSLLNSALTVSPLNPTARLALAQLDQAVDTPTISSRGLGLSRDAISLSWCARRLLATGHKEDALRMYASAFKLTIESGPARLAMPRYHNNPQAPRFLLPGEMSVREIVHDLLSKHAWTFDEWSPALPQNAMAFVAAARLLREQGLSEAQSLIDRITELREPPETVTAARALTLAARPKPAHSSRTGNRPKGSIGWRSSSVRTRRSSDRGGSTWRTSSCGSTTRASGRSHCGPPGRLRPVTTSPGEPPDIQRANIAPSFSRGSMEPRAN